MTEKIGSVFPLADSPASIKPLRKGPVSKTTADDPAKIKKAAEQFEALMIGQMLKSAREAGLSADPKNKDQAGQTEMQLADEKFASLIASKGGLGLAKFITSNLVRKT